MRSDPLTHRDSCSCVAWRQSRYVATARSDVAGEGDRPLGDQGWSVPGRGSGVGMTRAAAGTDRCKPCVLSGSEPKKVRVPIRVCELVERAAVYFGHRSLGGNADD